MKFSKRHKFLTMTISYIWIQGNANSLGLHGYAPKEKIGYQLRKAFHFYILEHLG
ncbi:hypothetical protein [Mucilaginibacter sp.]|uniref:hypothetical protein n=1 Tax=Mucilaginibacter sp. TaxID=1882438 RepID=UPI00374DEBF6